MLSEIKKFIEANQIYSIGYGVSSVTYFSYHGPQMEGLFELGFNFLVALVVGFTSWAYVAARIINGVCG